MSTTVTPAGTALIVGIGGQDGSYLARHLLDRGYRVVGTSRDAAGSRFEGLTRLGIKQRVKLVSMSLVDFRSTMQVVSRSEPDEIYNLAGQTSVGLSFEQPVETFESIIVGTVNLLETIRMIDRPIRLYNAGSSEMFGNTDGQPANEATILRPRSPYAIAKATSFWQVAQYREAYGLHAATASSSTTRAPCGRNGLSLRRSWRLPARSPRASGRPSALEISRSPATGAGPRSMSRRCTACSPRSGPRIM